MVIEYKQVDLLIAVHDVISNSADNDTVESDDDTDDDSDEEKERDEEDDKELQPHIDHINRVQDNFKALGLLCSPQKELEFEETESTDVIYKTIAKARFLSQRYNCFTSVLAEKDKDYHLDEYPQNHRFSIFVDRRNDKPTNGNKDEIIIFQHPADCNTLPPDHVPEIGFEFIRKCLIPRKDGHITADDDICGQLMTLTFQVEQKDEIRCYIVWNKQAS